LVRFWAMVAHVDSKFPRAVYISRTRAVHLLRPFLICVILLWLTSSAAHALDPNKRLTQYAHTAWRIQEGFFPNTPFWISQTKDGYLWVGGGSGALRFDGVRFTPWSSPIASTPFLHPLSIQAGEFWIASRDGLDHVKDNVVISHHDLPGIDAIYKDSDGSVWTLLYLSQERILCQVTDTDVRCFGKADGIAIHDQSSFIPDGKGGFWIGGDTSLQHWKMGGASEIYSPKHLQSNAGQSGFRSLVGNSDGSLWVGIMAAGPGLGLEKFRNGALTPVVLPNFDGSKLLVNKLMEDSDKNLWIATYGKGIYRIHGETVDHFGRADGLSSDTVYDLYEGADGIVWAATVEGIDNFRDLPVTTFSSSEGLGADGANSVMAGKDGTVWVANLGSLDFIRNGVVSSVRVPGEQSSSLLEDHRGNIWVGVDDALFLYKDGRFQSVTGSDGHPIGLVLGLAEDVEGDIWAVCGGFRRRLIRIRDFKVRDEFSVAQVPAAHTIAADPKGGVWVGTLTGDLTFFRDGIAHTYPLNLSGKSWVYQIAVDPDGSVIAASDDGLVVLRAGNVQHLNKKTGLPCDGVNGFAVDDNKNLWLSTRCGFIEIAASDVQRWWTHPDVIVPTRLFDTLDGALPGRVSFNPAAKSPDGRLWFVNNVALQMIDPSHLPGDGTVSPVYIETVVADRKEYKPQKGLQLPRLTRDLQIGYTAPSFLIPQKVKFRYRLDGHDRDWQDAGTRREAFYTDLGPGKYRFHVIACNTSGVWNEQGATLDFAIAPAFYQTVWFRSLGVFLFLAVLTGLYRLRLRHLERQRDALRKSEKELREVVETIPAMIHTARPDGHIDYFNQRWLEYLGVPLDEVAGWNWTAFIHADDVEGILARWRACLMTGEIFEYETRVRGANGEYRWMFHRKVPLRDANGNIVKWYGSSMDIHERKTAEEALQRSKAYLAEAQRLSKTGSFAWSTTKDNTYYSDECCRLLGFEPNETPPPLEAVMERIHPEDQPYCRELVERSIRDKVDVEFDYRIIDSDKSVRNIHCVSHPVLDQDGNLDEFIGTVIDVTERKRADEERQAAQQERERLNQLEADLAHINRVSTLGEMAASLAHEIKQPIAAAITSANSCIEWLAHEPPNLDRARAAAARIDKYGNRAAEIIDRIRSFYKKSPPQRELVDVNGIIQEMLTLLKGEATRHSIALRTDLSSELPKIMADPVQLQQVFMNLMLNGIEAMKDTGGELVVKSELQDGELQFSVSDMGQGLPSGNVDQIFSAFFTTKPQGSGMGLAISRSIVESHGGRLWASANDGHGAIFHFTLPIQVTESSPLVA
jgi:PAS domain S-box-containing protein